MTNEQLDAMVVNAPFLVSEYRKLKLVAEKTVTELDAELADENQALRSLVRRCIHTMRSGVLATDNVEAITTTAKELGAYK